MRSRISVLLLASGTLLVAGPVAMAWSSAPPDDKEAAEGEGKGKGKGSTEDDDQPDMPKLLPEGAVVPAVVTVPPVRADVFAGRAAALGRMAQCPKCSGTGVKVTRHRESQGHMKNPKITETTSDCPDCHGIGICPNPGRVGPVLDSFVGLLGALPADGASTPKQLDKARQALERLGATGDLVARIAEEDCTAISVERIPRKGEAISVTGVVGSPIPIGGGLRLFPVQVEGRALVLLRAPVINAAPPNGRVFVGGLCAGAVENVPWRWGKSAVLDVGFMVPWKDAPYKGAADADGDGKPDAPAKPGSGNAGK